MCIKLVLFCFIFYLFIFIFYLLCSDVELFEFIININVRKVIFFSKSRHGLRGKCYGDGSFLSSLAGKFLLREAMAACIA